MRRSLLWGLSALLVIFVLVPAAALPPGTSNYNKNSTTTNDCEDGTQGDSAGTVVVNSPSKLWPPNHKYFDGSVTATDEDSGDNVTLTLSGAHDQVNGDGDELQGAGNTTGDFQTEDGSAAQTKSGTGSVSIGFRVRSERSGLDPTGREYTINWVATFTDSDNDNSSEDMTVCRGSFTIYVPHDMRPSNR